MDAHWMLGVGGMATRMVKMKIKAVIVIVPYKGLSGDRHANGKV